MRAYIVGVLLFAMLGLGFIYRTKCNDLGYGCKDGKACAPHWQCNGSKETNSPRCCP